MTDPAMIERGDLKNKVRFAAMSKNEDMKKTEKRSGGQVCQVAVVDVCFNVTVLEGALLVYCLTAQMMTPTQEPNIHYACP